MEKFGFERLVKRLLDEKLHIETISTDRHVQIRKLMRESYPEINHEVDPWHIIKGLSKKLNAKSKKKGFETLGNSQLTSILILSVNFN